MLDKNDIVKTILDAAKVIEEIKPYTKEACNVTITKRDVIQGGAGSSRLVEINLIESLVLQKPLLQLDAPISLLNPW